MRELNCAMRHEDLSVPISAHVSSYDHWRVRWVVKHTVQPVWVGYVSLVTVYLQQTLRYQIGLNQTRD